MILKARIEDIDDILEIENSVIGHKNRESMIKKSIESGQCIVAEKSGKIVGYLLFDKNFFENNFIGLLVVSPEFRKKGIGSTLIINYEKIIGKGKIFTSTNSSNLKMINLLKKLNYLESGIVYNLDANDPELIFFKQI